MEVFLAIREDRHIDNDIRVFTSFDAAEEQVEIWKKDYPHITKWEEDRREEIDLSIYDSEGSTLLLLQADESQEEGFSLEIQKKEVHDNHVI